jgi:FecR protein
MLGASGLDRIMAIALLLGMSSAVRAADGDPWSISKSSGDVWVASPGAEQVSLNPEISLKPGDTVRTGSNGRVLLTRGEETMLIAPNSVVGLPTEKKDGMATTILQQAGSILLDVEKRNVKHFEVETPYLAAVVKGTQFRVTVNATDTKVEVSRGQVEVSSFKSGQIAQVLPGQAATAFAHGFTGLKLSGSGRFAPIEQGRPRAPSIERIFVPKGGLRAPSSPKGTSVRALAPFDKSLGMRAMTKPVVQEAAAGSPARPGVVRISVPLGEVKLNVAKATGGLAHGVTAPGSPKLSSGNDSMWNDAKAVGGTGGVAQAGAVSSSNGGSSAAPGGGSAAGGGGSGGVVGTTVTGVVGTATGVVGTATGVVGAATGDVGGIVNAATGSGNNGLHLGWVLGNGNSGKTH